VLSCVFPRKTVSSKASTFIVDAKTFTACIRLCMLMARPHLTCVDTARDTSMSSGLKLMTDRDLYVAPTTGSGYLDVDGAETE
jgi:hypothetical protein